MNFKKLWRNLTSWGCILLGNAMLAFLVAAFIIPHNILMGGTTGVSIILSRFIPVDTSILILIFNIALLILGFFVLGKKFFFTTVTSSILYPVLLNLMQRIPNIDKLTDDSLLAALFSGSLLGIAVGLVMRAGSSTGGTDIFNLVLSKFTHLPVSVFVWITDIVIIGGQALSLPPEKTLLGIVSLVIETLILQQVMILGKDQIEIYVISEKFEEIRYDLLMKLKAGVTMTMIETGLLGKNQKGVLCVIPPRKLYAATEMIQNIDPHAFITITKIKEVRGQGFTRTRLPVTPPKPEER